MLHVLPVLEKGVFKKQDLVAKKVFTQNETILVENTNSYMPLNSTETDFPPFSLCFPSADLLRVAT